MRAVAERVETSVTQKVSSSAQVIEALRTNIEQVVLGKPDEVKLVCVALFASGHVLLEDVPGVGKTTLAKALARSIRGEFRRIQFTADLLPSDIVGVPMFDRERREFEFRPGPIFANVVLADELNRGMPKTQGALLEAMNEAQVSIEGRAEPLPQPFLLLATENPVDHHGTFPLPESQLDRFLMRLPLGYPPRDAERQIVRAAPGSSLVERLQPVVELEQILELQRAVASIHCSEGLVDYLIELVDKSRDDRMLRIGVSPRGAQYLLRAAQALALVEGREFVLPEDLQRLAVPVLAHRVVLRGEVDASDLVGAAEVVIRRLVDEVSVPI